MTANGQPDQSRSARYVLKEYVNGKLLYAHAPPNLKQEEFHTHAPRIRPELVEENLPKQQQRAMRVSITAYYFKAHCLWTLIDLSNLSLIITDRSHENNRRRWSNIFRRHTTSSIHQGQNESNAYPWPRQRECIHIIGRWLDTKRKHCSHGRQAMATSEEREKRKTSPEIRPSWSTLNVSTSEHRETMNIQ